MIEKAKIRDLGQIITGNTPPTKQREYYGNYRPFIKATDITDSKYTYETEECYSEIAYEKYKRNKVPEGATCVVTIGSIGKKITKAHTELFVNQAINAVIPREEYDCDYIYYLLKYNLSQLNMFDSGTASGRENISKSSFSNITVGLENDIFLQKKIGKILSDYDDLIEMNKRRIVLLEQMAENLYKEWFVRFRFPCHEAVEFIAGEPQAWKLTKLEEIINIDRGLSYSSEEIDCDEGIDLVNLKNIQAFGGFRVDGTKKYSGKFKEQQIVKRGDLVMGVTDMTQDRRTVGAVALIPVIHNTSVISADLIKITSKLNNVFMYCMFKYGGVSRYISQFANGANVLHLRPQVVSAVKVFLPTENLIEGFSEIVQPIIDEIDLLNEKNDNLVKQRDLLLPRLMSGKLEIK